MKESIEDCFRQMAERKTTTLILDLRGNQGGEDERGLQLFSHLVSKPFRYYDKIIANHLEFRLSQYTERPVRLPEGDFRKTAAGRYSSAAHPMLGIQQPRPPYFAGKVIALMDGGSFSATCDFLSALHAAKRATFLGTETAGDYYGNSSIQFAMVTLPNTRLDIRIPLLTVYLSRKNPSAKPDHGIMPDILIEPSVQDLISGRDPAMERALGLARVKTREPRL
jgi:C-terminal processing protease CtpA/Prc